MIAASDDFDLKMLLSRLAHIEHLLVSYHAHLAHLDLAGLSRRTDVRCRECGAYQDPTLCPDCGSPERPWGGHTCDGPRMLTRTVSDSESWGISRSESVSYGNSSITTEGIGFSDPEDEL